MEEYYKKFFQYLATFFLQGIETTCKKLKSHDKLLSYLKDAAANPAHMAGLFCTFLVCPKNPLSELDYLHIFAITSSSRQKSLVCQMLEIFFDIFLHTTVIIVKDSSADRGINFKLFESADFSDSIFNCQIHITVLYYISILYSNL